MTTGDCFQASLHLARELDAVGSSGVRGVRIVHGLPVGQGPQNFGHRYWHAWVEAITERGPWVFDYGSGRNIAIKRASYYRIGKLTDDHIWRFTVLEASQEAIRTGHYGPWVEGWEDMGL